jgi:L-2-hydroxyglutarate oxidase LhgO
MDEIDCAVIGGGVVGLAVARALALAGREVLVLETEGAIGTGTSSRNSEVIHAGIYYPQGSLKAQLCVEGKDLLYAYAPSAACRIGAAASSSWRHRPAGGQLEAIRAKAAANGVDDLVLLTAQQAMAMEPQLHCVARCTRPAPASSTAMRSC